ncbi:MAG: N-acetylmuramoyl-L-alanine amidase [Opitutaceae bacterium]|nr:N-acetylmuramoyl-L-alanine amidase [Opitutaceae bacterium]
MQRFKSPFLKFLYLVFSLALFSLNTSAQEYKTVKAQKGDGVYSLLKKHGLPTTDFNRFVELNKDLLGQNNALIIGRSYQLPSVSSPSSIRSENKSIQKLFGTKYQQVEIKDNQLKDAVYYLISGHGGPDPGAVGKYENHLLCEDEYAYDVTLRLARNLMKHGALVYIIIQDKNDGIRAGSILEPDKDEVCYPDLKIPANQKSRLRQRKNAVNKLYSKHKGRFQRLIVIHIDSRSQGENIDVFFYHDKRSKTGKKLVTNLQETFDRKYKQYQPGRGYRGTVSARNLYIIRHSYPPTAFIELGNINHPRDKLRFIKDNNRQALANWLEEGLIKDFKNNK